MKVQNTFLLLACLFTFHAAGSDWADAMKAAHAKGGWEKGSVSQIGDSITYTKAFLAGLAWGELKSDDWSTLTGHIKGKLLNDRKGPEHCNFSGWTAADGLSKIKDVIAAEKPEIAVIMYGTNDVKKGTPPDAYLKNMSAIVETCIQAGCVPILSTIPPVMGNDDKVKKLNEIVEALASEKHVPLIDFHAEILTRQPGTAWDGTLLGKGDVHPTGGNNFDFSDANLKICGYALRNYLTCKAMKEVIEKCF